jgi:hypothetical protein
VGCRAKRLFFFFFFFRELSIGQYYRPSIFSHNEDEYCSAKAAAQEPYGRKRNGLD